MTQNVPTNGALGLQHEAQMTPTSSLGVTKIACEKQHPQKIKSALESAKSAIEDMKQTKQQNEANQIVKMWMVGNDMKGEFEKLFAKIEELVEKLIANVSFGQRKATASDSNSSP